MGLPAMKIDTYKSVKGLVNKGMKESHAEGIVEFVRNNTPDLSHLATKEQLNAVEERLKAEIRAEVASVRVEMHTMTWTMLKWILPFLFAIIIGIFFKK